VPVVSASTFRAASKPQPLADIPSQQAEVIIGTDMFANDPDLKIDVGGSANLTTANGDAPVWTPAKSHMETDTGMAGVICESCHSQFIVTISSTMTVVASVPP
jgi:hypothetical protein